MILNSILIVSKQPGKSFQTPGGEFKLPLFELEKERA